MLERMWRKGNPLTLLVGMQTGTTTMENSMEVPSKNEYMGRVGGREMQEGGDVGTYVYI